MLIMWIIGLVIIFGTVFTAVISITEKKYRDHDKDDNNKNTRK